MQVEVYESSDMQTSVSGADVSMKAEMPTHGHGMNTTPMVSDNGDGSYTIDGMKFHMNSEPGHPWTMDIGVTKDGTTDVAKFQVIMKGN